MLLISLVVATHNRRRHLQRLLAAVAEQDWPQDRLEVVVVDNNSSDGTAEFLCSLAGRCDLASLRVLHEERPGKSHALNAGLRAARGDLLAFTDDDVVPERQWLTQLIAAMQETKADFGLGRITPIWEAPRPAWLRPELYGVLAIPDNGPERLPVRAGTNEHAMPIGANMALRRHVVATIGGWRTDLGKLRKTLRSGEDHEFFLRMLRAGFSGVYEPSACVGHVVPAARLERDYFRRWLYDNGQIVAELEREYPTTSRYLLRVPRYLWREAVTSAAELVRSGWRGDEGVRFARETRLRWFVGYVRRAWSAGPASPEPSRPAPFRPSSQDAAWLPPSARIEQ